MTVVLMPSSPSLHPDRRQHSFAVMKLIQRAYKYFIVRLFFDVSEGGSRIHSRTHSSTPSAAHSRTPSAIEQLDSELLRNMLNGTIGSNNSSNSKMYGTKHPSNGNAKWACKCFLALFIVCFIAFWCMIIFYASRRDPGLDIIVSDDFKLPILDGQYDDVHKVPLLFHQMWKSERIPAKWKGAHEGCVQLNQEYELILWTDEMIYNFIFQHYPWFYLIFLNYPYHIQRVDVARYFILHYYGGVYLDIDASCKTPFREIISNMTEIESVLLPMTDIYGVTNSFMVAKPKSKFFEYVIYELPNYAYGGYKLIRHTTIIFSTGPMFMSTCVRAYSKPEAIHVMTLSDYDEKHFYHAKGGSWHGIDTEIVDAFHFHYVELLIILNIVIIILLVCRYKPDVALACSNYCFSYLPCCKQRRDKLRDYSVNARFMRDNHSHSRTSSRDLDIPVKNEALMA